MCIKYEFESPNSRWLGPFIYVLFVHLCMIATGIPGARVGGKRVLDPLG